MTCDEFFAAAIDPVEAPEPSVRAEIERHRASCRECAELARDWPAVLALGRALPATLPAPPGAREKILVAAQAAIDARAASRRRRVFLVAAALLALLALGLGAGYFFMGRGGPPEQDQGPILGHPGKSEK